MNTIEKLGDEETFRQIVERSITSFTDDELTAIAGYSFCSCKELQEVSLPLVTELPMAAFQNCLKLTAFDFSNIVKINADVFISTGLTEVNGPLVTSIGSNAFASCSSLTSAKLPKATFIGSSAFYNCSRLSSLIVGTELEDETAICTLDYTGSLPSSIGAIYVPYNLVEKYKTATNWSSFASKIQAYDAPVSCQSLTITAEDVPWYETSTKIHYEAVCTYSIEGIMQPETKIFKGDVVSDTFGTNSSEESSRQIEVSYTFLGQTATTTITQGKHLGNPIGGKIFYIDDTADGTYLFYDVEGNPMSDVSIGSTPSSYTVLTAGSKDKYYVYNDAIYDSLQWGKYSTSTGATGTAIGTGKSNTATLLATDAVSSTKTIWYKLQQIRDASTGGNNDWFVPSKDEIERLRLAVNSGSITGGTIAGSSYAGSVFKSKYLWSSSEYSSRYAWVWYSNNQDWYSSNSKINNFSVFFARAF